MKFYNRRYDGGDWDIMDEADDGQWATRTDAEQAAKDAVAMARIILGNTMIYGAQHRKAQAIIERYEGGEG